MKYVFVVLHYNEKTVPDTCECVESIQSNLDNEYHIVVVENGSGDNSLNLLQDAFIGKKGISLLCSEENLGFARGNNLGCDYAIEHFTPDYLIVINNDTMIYQKDFLDQVENIYLDSQFHILGPYIQDRSGNPQNPIKSFPASITEVDNSISKLEKKQQILNRSCFKYWLKFKMKRAIKKFIKSKIGHVVGTDELSREIHKNIGLHGSALIFSKDYYQKYDHVFYPGTFMYKEEDILYYRIKQHNLTSLYHPGIKIHHKEDRSTDTAFTGGCEKEKFIIARQLESFHVFRNYILKDKPNG